MNNVTLIGRLTADPELSYTNNQTAVCHFTLAVNRMKKEDGADFIRITAWGKQAENCGKYLSKGRQAAVQGRITTGSYTDKIGKKVYTTEVTAQHVEFLGGGSGGSGGEQTQQPYQAQQTFDAADYGLPGDFAEAEDQIPF